MCAMRVLSSGSPNDNNYLGYAPLVCTLSDSDIFTEADILHLLNLSVEELKIIQVVSPFKNSAGNIADPEILSDRRDITFGLMSMFKSLLDDVSSTDLDDFDDMVRRGDARSLYSLIVRKTPPQNRYRTAPNFKYIDNLGHFRAKVIPNENFEKPKRWRSPRTLSPVRPEPHLKDFSASETGGSTVYKDDVSNSYMFNYLTITRGLSPTIVNYFIEHGDIYQGLHQIVKDGRVMTELDDDSASYHQRLVMVVNGLSDETGNPLYQSMRGLWDKSDTYHRSQLRDKKHPELFVYNTVGRYTDKAGKIRIFHKFFKPQTVIDPATGAKKITKNREPMLGKDGKQITDIHLYKEPSLFDYILANGLELKPIKMEVTGCDKTSSWRFINPSLKRFPILNPDGTPRLNKDGTGIIYSPSHHLIICEGFLDALSHMDLTLMKAGFYGPSDKKPIKLTQEHLDYLPNYIVLSGLSRGALDSFLDSVPHIHHITIFTDGDAPGLKSAIDLRAYLCRQFNYTPENVTLSGITTQAKTVQAVEQRTENGKTFYVGKTEGDQPVFVKDINDYLRAWKAAKLNNETLNEIDRKLIPAESVPSFKLPDYDPKVVSRVAEDYSKRISVRPPLMADTPFISSSEGVKDTNSFTSSFTVMPRGELLSQEPKSEVSIHTVVMNNIQGQGGDPI